MSSICDNIFEFFPLNRVHSFDCLCLACKGEYPRAQDLPKDYEDSPNLRDCRTGKLWSSKIEVCPGCGCDASELEGQRARLTEDISGAIGAGNAARALQLYWDDFPLTN